MNNTSSDNSETETLPRGSDRYWDTSCLSSHLILKIKSFLSCSTVTKKKFVYYLPCHSFCNQYQRCSMSVILRDPATLRMTVFKTLLIYTKQTWVLAGIFAVNIEKVNTGVGNGWSKKSTYLLQKTLTEPKRKLGTKTNERTEKCTQKCWSNNDCKMWVG